VYFCCGYREYPFIALEASNSKWELRIGRKPSGRGRNRLGYCLLYSLLHAPIVMHLTPISDGEAGLVMESIILYYPQTIFLIKSTHPSIFFFTFFSLSVSQSTWFKEG
jgi:hypothetical protein